MLIRATLLRLRFAVLLLLSGAALGQAAPAVPVSPYRNLVMEGGGIRGIAYGGALLELEQRGVLSQLRRGGGTPAGARQAALLGGGCAARGSADGGRAAPAMPLDDAMTVAG